MKSDGYDMLVVLSDSFPFGSESERVFMTPELEAATDAFGRVVLMPTTMKTESPTAALPDGVVVVDGWARSAECRSLLRGWRLIKPSILWNIRGDISYRGLTFSLIADAMASFLGRWIEREGVDLERTLFYSFWFDIGAAALTILSRRNWVKWVSAAHGFDIYTARGGRFRREMARSAVAIFPASESGGRYMIEKLGVEEEKIEPRRLGCVKLKRDKMADRHSPAERALTFLSVSNVIDIKRVELNGRLLKALAVARPGTVIRWIHVGGGAGIEPMKEQFAADTMPENMIVEFMGEMDNEQLQREVYGSMKIDWFMLLSSYEGGNPIAVCEAMSYGVPAILSDTTGLADMAEDDFSVLLPVDVTDEEFVRGMLPYLESDARRQTMGDAAFERWEQLYDARKTRIDFMKRIKQV